MFSTLAAFLLAIALLPQAFAQETTAGLEGVIKDPTGALIKDATIQLMGDKLIGAKTIRADASGYYRYTNLPPGKYTLIVTAPGFSESKNSDIVLNVGHVPSINVTLSLGSESTVVEVSATSPLIDVTQTRTQTNVTQEQIAFEPRGTSFQSVIIDAPGARSEPLQGSYQINGGAGNENGYLIDGMTSSSLVNGSTQANVPFEFLQEVQIKTTGFEAENPGGLGGVVNAIPNRGSKAWHGQIWAYYEADPLDASPSASLRNNPQASAVASTRTDVPYQFYNPVKDHFRYLQPGVTAGGPLLTNRIWVFAGLQPYFTSLRRNVTFIAPYGPRTLDQDTQRYFTTVRLDGRVTDKIRVFGSFLYQYYRASGTSLPNQDSINGLFNSSSTTAPDSFQHGIGNVQPNFLATTGADITINPSLVATTKYGYFYQNYQDRGLPQGVRYVFAASGLSSTGSVKAIDGTAIKPGDPLYQSSGFQTLPSNSQYLANQSISHQFNQDVAYFKKGLAGTHNFKFGYQLNHLYNNVNNAYNTGLVEIIPGQSYSPLASNQPNCAAIEATNLTRYGAVDNSGSKTINPVKCMGNYGYAYIREFGTVGAAASFNHGFYAQDQWTVARGITLNLGIRVEKETLPAYDAYPSGINFGWGDKVAPRLGASWDVLQNGKLKVFGSYGVFYDVMKLGLAIDSFGGAYWHNCYYALDDQNYTTLNPVRDASGHYCGGTGNANFAGSGTTPPSNLRFIENQNFRIPANDPSQGSSVAPGLKPYRQHETTGGADYQISRMWTVEATYDRRRLDHAIEDAGTITPAGETFLIVNPGQGTDLQPVANCATCKNQPAAARSYDSLEIRFRRLADAHWGGSFSYTYSKLRGNYSGLTATDTSDGGGARLSPNDNRSFDEPFFQFTSHGTPFNGLLATDRPHTAKGDLYYRISYLRRHETSIGLLQQLYSGSPLSTYEDVAGTAGSYPTYVEGRGKFVPATLGAGNSIVFGTPVLRRTPIFAQSDVSLTHTYKVSDQHENWRLGFEANFLNLLNTKHAVEYNTHLNTSNLGSFVAPPGYADAKGNLQYGVLESPYDYQGLSNSQNITLNSSYGLPTTFQAGRSIRLKGKFTF
ncbi:TonB-dependent receptor [Granulicella arctica]|uniref:TonB-dependent receptor n=1 Tax=Granulicella arctica TaxID=940613 RepID=UPI0021DFC948|nr:TonB-dependent receptor [Granulicella arctica]